MFKKMALVRCWHTFVIAITIFAQFQQIYTSPISVPVVWPDNASSTSNRQTISNRRTEIINERPNSDFNRLVFSRIGHSVQNPNSQGYVDYVDKPERLTNNFATQGERPNQQQNVGNDKLVFHDTESRTKFLFKKKFKKKRKKICLPIGYGHGKADRLRTLYDINVIFADVSLNEYDAVGGYGCKPFYGLSGGNGGHGSHGSHGTHGSHGSHHGGSQHGGSNYGSHTDTDTDSYDDGDEDYVNQNDHGSLIQTDDYNHQSSVSSQGNHDLFGGSIHGTASSNHNNNNNGNGYASGGPLGFFGQGGLFDFSNSGGRPPTSGTLGDSIGDTVKPVIEINVPDTIQDALQGNWRPGNLVGGVQNSVSGFIQQISDRPGETIRQINREITSIFRSFTDLF
ncbi:hypothetical protein Bhyg_06786 [Pseudolycoriella hygida]|uniref:Uncharacterized protein n=1 Tax=Pseudolycoriella hygida TaxID=35572 RepID=A0A9Q0N2X2_9DIPT|nr:hypothetical protein Bhyg_06786 [Pseudolycoriella hygida]